MADPTILRGSDYFFTTIYEGNGGGQRVGNFVPFTDNGTIAKSCIFNRADSPNLSKTYGSAGTSQKKFTFSCWLKKTKTSTDWYNLFNVGDVSGSYFNFGFNSGGQNPLQVYDWTGSTYRLRRITNRTFEDTSKWYHILLAVDTTESSGSDRVKIYVDGDQLTSFSTSVDPSQDLDTLVGSADNYNVGSMTSNFLDGYLAEVNYVDGTALTPSTFGLTDTSTGRWIPKTLTGITYGSNGFRMQFANSAGQTIGDDTSGNGNDFTVTNLAASDITTDSPTQNHPTFDSFRSSDWTFTEGNLTCAGTPSSGAGRHSFSNMILPKSGKYYFEMTVDVNNDSPRYFGLAKADSSVTEGTTANLLPRVVVPRNGGTNDGHFISDGTNSSANGFSTTTGTVINFALDATNEKLYVGKDGSYYDFEGGSGNPTNGTGATFSNIYKTIDWRVANISFSTGTGGTSHKVTWNFGQKTFAHTAPTGYSALQQDNFPAADKDFADFVWIKNRDQADSHQLYDTNRGRHKDLHSDNTQTEGDITDGVQKFLNGGFEIEDNTQVNTSGESYVSWTWHLNGGTTAANTDGSGATLTSTVQANQDAGVSIVTYAGSSSGSKTVAHGLTEIPEMIWIKNMTDTRNWFVYHKNASYASMVPYDGNAAYYMLLNSSNARDSGNVFNNTAPTNKIFHIQDAGSLNTNGSGKNYIAYVFHSVAGFSKIGLYKGNGNANGPYVYTGFKPSFLLVKCLSPSGRNWILWDNKRSTINPCDNVLYPDLSQAETTSGNDMDFLSNGFKPRGTNSNYNESSRNYTYMAFAEHPFIGDGTNPVTAR